MELGGFVFLGPCGIHRTIVTTLSITMFLLASMQRFLLAVQRSELMGEFSHLLTCLQGGSRVAPAYTLNCYVSCYRSEVDGREVENSLPQSSLSARENG